MREHLEPDIGTAAYLAASGFVLLGLVAVGPNRYAFRFADSHLTAADMAEKYFAGAHVEAKALMDALRSLKDRLYAEKGNRNGNGDYFARHIR